MSLTLDPLSLLTYKFLFFMGLLFLIFLLVYLLWNFPWILKYYHLDVYDVENNDCLAILSDIHLDVDDVFPSDILRVISQYNARSLIIAGDFIEYYHRKIDEDSLRKILISVLGPVLEHPHIGEIYYITSTSSHDPRVSGIIEYVVYRKKIVVLPGVLRIRHSNNVIYVTHGDYACRNGGVATFLNILMRKLFGKNMFIERLLKRRLRIPQDSWLICGHTHIPGVDERDKLANTGSWRNKWSIKSSRTIIFISNNKLNMIKLNKNMDEVESVKLLS